MKQERFARMWAGLEPWREDFGQGMESRGADGLSWYDLSINANSIPCEAQTAIIVTSWAGQLKWLAATLAGYRATGAFVILAYDNPFYPWMAPCEGNVLRCLPNQKHYVLANSVVMKHITADSDKRNGWFWSVRYAQGILRQFPQIKHVYVTNGDCLWEKPEGLPDLINLLGEADLLPGQSNPGLIHTAAMFFKAEAFHDVFDYMAGLMQVPVIGSRSPEVMLLEATTNLNMQVVHAPVQPLDLDGSLDCYARYGQDSTFKRLVGFRNLFAEYEVAGNEGRDPKVEKYVDLWADCLYWGGEERETICQFWKTGDRRYLYMWLSQWEDSDYNRLFYPLEAFGPTPIYEPQQNEPVYFTGEY